ncbi:hypothetical protein [Frankia sp. CiP1_Cm_nod2]|uniref:hypothetical protein n=1 Tax=Frankia sp. CiP1_Cm_nod2 TaxID=2897161 RepID=UPI0020259787
MRPMLDGLELPHVQEIGTYDRRVLAEHQAPGGDGSQLQDLGRRPTRVALWGVATGTEAAGFIDELQQRFRSGSALPFVADITTDARIDKVVIDDLQLQELGGRPERTAFVLSLRQFLEPAEPAGPATAAPDVLGDATELMDRLVDGLALGQAFVTGLEKFVETLSPFVERISTLNELLTR